MSKTPLNNTTLIRYNKTKYHTKRIETVEQLAHLQKDGIIQWVNTSYGKVNKEQVEILIAQNKLDDFLLHLLLENHPNKVIELNNVLFVAIEVFQLNDNFHRTEQMTFILNSRFIWSIQEETGNYFEGITKQLYAKTSLLRNKKVDYLFFLILNSIIDNYENTFEKISAYNNHFFGESNIKPTPKFISFVENRKQEIFKFKKSTKALRDIIIKLEQTELANFNGKYFAELKEQINNLLADIDFELQNLESKLNLIFSIQGHHLNEIMKILTIVSVVFTPITFLANVYEMNFANMPALQSPYGFFILLAVMLALAMGILLYLKKKKWF